eukprot:TRINITY_DN1201_c0_g1_i2.p1 TRINITY_DN1201_c0_g1~~TRINITY_DN1201_c0_g1_i2.p1  ORF type:complete len:645 (+),score=161.37 TRINITY_DN1201_c0_g1_i2:201-2135(+)
MSETEARKQAPKQGQPTAVIKGPSAAVNLTSKPDAIAGNKSREMRLLGLRIPEQSSKFLVAVAGGALHIGWVAVKEALGFATGASIGVAVACIVLSRRRSLTVQNAKVGRVADVDDKERLKQLLLLVPAWVKSPGMERTGWLNEVFQQAWSHIDTVGCDFLLKNIWPIVKEKLLEQDIHIKFRSITMGNLPFVIEHIKAVDVVDRSCVLEMKVRFYTNASIIADVKVKGVLRTVAHVKEIHAHGDVRLTFTPLTTQFPCFAGVYISLLEKPYIDCCAEALGGLDIFVLPKVKDLVTNIVHGVLGDLMIWPRQFHVALQHEALKGQKKTVGTMTLQVTKAGGFGRNKSPYVKVHVDNTRQSRTTWKERTSGPVEWDEQLMLAVHDVEKDVVKVDLMDYNALLSDKLLGSTSLSLTQLKLGITETLTLQLSSKRGGGGGGGATASSATPGSSSPWVQVDATYRPFRNEVTEPEPQKENLDSQSKNKARKAQRKGRKEDGKEDGADVEDDSDFVDADDILVGGEAGMLEVHVMKASDLEPLNNGNLSCYCSLSIGRDVRKTRVVEGSTFPEWEEDFEFLFDAPPVNRKLHVEVWHKEEGMLGDARRLMGVLEIKLADVVSNERLVSNFALIQAKQGELSMTLTWRCH